MGLLASTPAEARRLPSSEASDLFERVRELVKKNNLPQAQAALEKELLKFPAVDSQDLMKFQLGYFYFTTQQFEKSALTFHEFLQLKSQLEDYGHYYLAQNYLKLGIVNTYNPDRDMEIVNGLYDLLNEYGIDMTTFFRSLSNLQIKGQDNKDKVLIDKEEFVKNISKYSISYQDKVSKSKPKLSCDQISKLLEMQSINPHILSRYGIDSKMLKDQQEKSKDYENLRNSESQNPI